MGTETLPSSPDAAREVAPSTRDFLEQLKADVQAVGDDEGKKALIRERLKGMEKKDLDALKQNIDQNQIPQDLLDAIVDLRLLVDAQKAMLREAITNGQTSTTEQKPEGWMAWAGDQMKGGANTVTGWMKKLGSWSSDNAGKGWKHFVEGATATIAAIGSGLAWLREKSAQMFGSLAASVDDYLPDWLKKPLNVLMGDFGVAYKNFTKFKIEVLPNDPKQELSLQPFMEKFSMISVTGQTVSFDEYCRLVALKLRENPANRTVIPLKVTQMQLEQAADQVTQQKLNAPPPAPAVVPGTVPGAAPVAAVAGAAAPGVKPAEGQAAPSPVYTFETIPDGTNLLGTSQKLTLDNHTFDIFASGDGTIKVDTLTYKLKVKKYGFWVSPSVEKLNWQKGKDGLECTGSFIFSDTQLIARSVLEDFLRKHLKGDRSFENEKVSLKQVS